MKLFAEWGLSLKLARNKEFRKDNIPCPCMVLSLDNTNQTLSTNKTTNIIPPRRSGCPHPDNISSK